MARYWLMKSEPGVFSIDDLAKAKAQTTRWDGVRNYQARNLLRDDIAVGDGVLFYHSSADPPARVVDIQFDSKFKREVTLPELRATPALADMVLLRRGSRLSVQPVSPGEWKQIVKLGARA